MTKKMEKKILAHTTPDACPTCASVMKESTGRLKFPVNGEEISVPNMTFLKCPSCQEIVLRLDESRRLRESAIDCYRTKYHLLSGEEIRSLRERNSLTQSELAELLQLGINTLSRWESGR